MRSGPTVSQQVAEFHRNLGYAVRAAPTIEISEDEREFRAAVIDDERQELREAMDEGDLIAIADALGDSTYVVFGTALSYGIDLEGVIDEIHRSNMTKELPSDVNGKAFKGERYERPELASVLRGPPI
jgi:predicted HAD superfamily Cof-like phosphohydrolase